MDHPIVERMDERRQRAFYNVSRLAPIKTAAILAAGYEYAIAARFSRRLCPISTREKDVNIHPNPCSRLIADPGTSHTALATTARIQQKLSSTVSSASTPETTAPRTGGSSSPPRGTAGRCLGTRSRISGNVGLHAFAERECCWHITLTVLCCGMCERHTMGKSSGR